MSKLQNLVPPLELCKLIPEGEFSDSCFVWSFSCDRRIEEPFVDFREDVAFCRKNMVNTPDTYPAPTLEEILQELINLSAYRINVCKSWGEWHIDCYDNERLLEKDSEKNIATAALKLWLELKGEKV